MTIRKLPSNSNTSGTQRPDTGPGPGPGEGSIALPPAGLPSRNPTASYWLRELSPVLRGHRTTETLPETADVVVVGSGITGAFASWFLKKGGYYAGEKAEGEDGGDVGRVVMLEAREVCGGATGRVS